MATVAFIIGYHLDRGTGFKHDNGVVVDLMSDGTPRQRTTASVKYATIKCKFSYLSAVDKDDLVEFLVDNAANTITWNIDGVNYSGVFVGGHSVTMTGVLFNVEFDYYAAPV